MNKLKDILVETLAEGDNTITVSYGDLSASFTVRAGSISGPMGGDFDGGEYVKKKVNIITVAAIGGLLVICIALIFVLLGRMPKKKESCARGDSDSADNLGGDREDDD